MISGGDIAIICTPAVIIITGMITWGLAKFIREMHEKHSFRDTRAEYERRAFGRQLTKRERNIYVERGIYAPRVRDMDILEEYELPPNYDAYHNGR
ncbi:hypothetical protein TWF569_000360 [Orbilia oligospora]|uniref:Uncharacterized protein n=1 Tax=Orbilia oligospora TaxID=2813651 RepID=A0A7C8JJJ5_ORBOL|nr:hypothetical protein TWF102_006813 [Orbilia oligospora]KAF3114540.1 hypothetical protein TWF103_001007 [Orbilia oligospora]KAF3116267.1 hypothetical protein TWF706_003918 [Orbilia oligospora]KAF3133782.1 hypothetical protein TWF594_008941 [Orbilia oligospora]KAF3154384.1 hypothetical protein TWF569_000360 [Orbilia oligospora]